MKKAKIKICIILGTRPEIIKMAPIIQECKKRKLDYFVLHTGQHYNENMDRIFFNELNIASPKYNLKIGSQPYCRQIGMMTRGITAILQKERPNVAIVQGDTVSVLAGALAANKLGIKVAHHEAGLRSYDNSMPEENIRIIVDHISDFLMAPTAAAFNNLKQEGTDEKKIFITGNTIVGAVLDNLDRADGKINIFEKLNLKKKSYFLATCHRQENIDNMRRLKDIIYGLSLVHQNFKVPLVFPMHPRTKNAIKKNILQIPSGIRLVDPVGFLEFLQLESGAKLILTDSGGVQEEACILNVPCVTLRENTERPETLDIKSNMLAGSNPERILESSVAMLKKEKKWKNPFGSRHAAKIIIGAILQSYEAGSDRLVQP